MKKKRGQRTYQYLLAHDFTQKEAGAFSQLLHGTNNPVLKLIVRDRSIRRRNFERIAAGKLERGQWRWQDIERKWTDNLVKMYKSRGWWIRFGPDAGASPWAMYRHFEPIAPKKRDVSPWELRRYPGKKQLEKGLLFIQSIERGAKKASATQLRLWITQKTEAVRKARGQRKAQLKIELGRLNRLLERSA